MLLTVQKEEKVKTGGVFRIKEVQWIAEA